MSKFMYLFMLVTSIVFGLTACSASSTKRLDVTKLGVVKNDLNAAAKNTEKINEIISSAQEGSVVYFPPGKYYIEASIQIKEKSNITIKGKDATIINASYNPRDKSDRAKYGNSRIISFENNTNVTMEGLHFDFYNHTSASGVITAMEDGYTYIKLFEEYYNDKEKPRLRGGEFAVTVNIFTSENIPLEEYWPASQDVGYETVMKDAENGIYGIEGYFGNIGDRIVIRFTMASYASPAFTFRMNDGIKVKNCWVYCSPSSTFEIGQNNKNFSFDGFSIAPKKGSEAIWSSNVDGIYVIGLRGSLQLKNCVFVGLGDDSLNVHHNAARVASVDAAKSEITLVSASGGRPMSGSWCEAGDTLMFYGASFTPIGTATIKEYKDSVAVLDAIPEGLEAGAYVANRAMMPSVIIDKCSVSNSRARAFLIQTENVEIRNCSFEKLRLAAILIAPDIDRWNEMGPSANVYIHDNTFKNICTDYTNDYRFGAITIKTSHDAYGANSPAPIHKNIRIENNKFENIGHYCVFATSTDGLVIKDNDFSSFGMYSYAASPSDNHSIYVSNSKDVQISGNSNENILQDNVSFREQ